MCFFPVQFSQSIETWKHQQANEIYVPKNYINKLIEQAYDIYCVGETITCSKYLQFLVFAVVTEFTWNEFVCVCVLVDKYKLRWVCIMVGLFIVNLLQDLILQEFSNSHSEIRATQWPINLFLYVHVQV